MMLTLRLAQSLPIQRLFILLAATFDNNTLKRDRGKKARAGGSEGVSDPFLRTTAYWLDPGRHTRCSERPGGRPLANRASRKGFSPLQPAKRREGEEEIVGTGRGPRGVPLCRDRGDGRLAGQLAAWPPGPPSNRPESLGRAFRRRLAAALRPRLPRSSARPAVQPAAPGRGSWAHGGVGRLRASRDRRRWHRQQQGRPGLGGTGAVEA